MLSEFMAAHPTKSASRLDFDVRRSLCRHSRKFSFRTSCFASPDIGYRPSANHATGDLARGFFINLLVRLPRGCGFARLRVGRCADRDPEVVEVEYVRLEFGDDRRAQGVELQADVAREVAAADGARTVTRFQRSYSSWCVSLPVSM
jgi:hypothetical protein